MEKKVVWVFYHPFGNKEDDHFINKVKDDVLGTKSKEKSVRPRSKDICICFCPIKTSKLILFGVRNFTKKRKPHMVVFHECDSQLVESYSGIIRKVHKRHFHVLTKERYKNGNGVNSPFQIMEYKHIPSFLTAVQA